MADLSSILGKSEEQSLLKVRNNIFIPPVSPTTNSVLGLDPK